MKRKLQISSCRRSVGCWYLTSRDCFSGEERGSGRSARPSCLLRSLRCPKLVRLINYQLLLFGPSTHHYRIKRESSGQLLFEIIHCGLLLFDMQGGGGGGQRPCKFGERCNKLAQGICTFYHPPSHYQNSNNSKPGGFTHHQREPGRNQPNYGGNQGQFNFNSNQPQSNYKGFQGQPNYNQGGYNPNPNNNSNPNRPPREEGGLERQFCRMWQLGQDCKFGEKCRNKHCFMLPKEDALLRLQFIRTVPCHAMSRLTSFSSGGKQFFAMRNGAVVNFFQFDFETKGLLDVFKYDFPDPAGKYNFYDHKVRR